MFCVIFPQPHGTKLSFKGFCPYGGGTLQGRGSPPVRLGSFGDISASFRSYPKSFRIWSFQTDMTSRFQGFWRNRCSKLEAWLRIRAKTVCKTDFRAHRRTRNFGNCCTFRGALALTTDSGFAIKRAESTELDL